MTIEEAKAKLKEGNQAYVKSGRNPGTFERAERERLAREGQHPYACVISCSDSRVVPEHIFSAGLGQLFTIRNAGNVIGVHEIGSCEYAAEHLHVPLIVVLGHTYCGAVEEAFKQAADTHEKQKEDALESPIEELVREILEVTGEYTDTSAMEIENARAGVEKLRKDPTLARLAADGELAILAAIYDTESGFVRFDI